MLPEWFPPMYAHECREAVECGCVSMEWVLEGICMPHVSDFLFDPFDPSKRFAISEYHSGIYPEYEEVHS